MYWCVWSKDLAGHLALSFLFRPIYQNLLYHVMPKQSSEVLLNNLSIYLLKIPQTTLYFAEFSLLEQDLIQIILFLYIFQTVGSVLNKCKNNQTHILTKIDCLTNIDDFSEMTQLNKSSIVVIKHQQDTVKKDW